MSCLDIAEAADAVPKYVQCVTVFQRSTGDSKRSVCGPKDGGSFLTRSRSF
jgi:hypothetical protein